MQVSHSPSSFRNLLKSFVDEAQSIIQKKSRQNSRILRAPQTLQSPTNNAQTLQQPEPRPSKRPYASFLEDFVDPVYPYPRPESLYEFISSWLSSIGSDREKHCRSDSHLHRSDHDPISRQLSRSAPEMSFTRHPSSFVPPLTPTSFESQSSRAATDDGSSTADVHHPSYRRNNLYSNGVDVLPANTQFPSYISDHLVGTLRAKRDSPGLKSEEINEYTAKLEALQRGCTEADVEGLFTDLVFPKNSDLPHGRWAGLESTKSISMSRHLVPNNFESPFRISQPKPDLLYGYSGDHRDQAFTQPQFLAQASLNPRNTRATEATTQGLRFPFLAIDFKAAGGTRGDLWVAVNEGAGASAACLNAADQLNIALQNYGAQSVDNLSYCIAMDNNVAQLYISWKEGGLKYYLQRVDAFLLSRPEDFVTFRNQVRNIFDWGKNARLAQIGQALDIIIEENRQSASEAVKSRPAPSDSSVGSKRSRKVSSRRSSGRSNVP